MRILGIDKRRGWVRIAVKSSIDLLNLYRQVRPGDIIYQETTREVKKHRASGEVDSERLHLKLAVTVESKDVDPLSRRVRFHGRITYVDQDLDILKKYHTLSVERGSVIEIESKDRLPYIVRMAELTERAMHKEIAVISADDEALALVHISDEGFRIIRTSERPGRAKIPGYTLEEDTGIYDEIVEDLRRLLEKGVKRVVLVGTSIHIETLMREIKRRDPGLASLVRKRSATNVGGVEGLREALRSGALGEDLKPLADALRVERLIELATKSPEKVYIGLREVHEACQSGQRLEVLVTEEFVWQNLNSAELDFILNLSERGRVTLRILLPETEASEKVKALGSIVGFRPT